MEGFPEVCHRLGTPKICGPIETMLVLQELF